MKREITARDAFCLLLIMVIASTPITGIPLKLQQDNWIALLLAVVPMMLLMLLYTRLTVLMPGKSLYEMAEMTLGKAGGKIVGALFAMYAALLAAVVLNGYTTFIHLTSLIKTPIGITAIMFVIPAIYLAKCGIASIGRWSFILAVAALLLTTCTLLLSLPSFNAENLLPIMDHSLSEIAQGALNAIPYPLGETVLLLTLLGDLRKGSKPHRIYILGGLFTLLFVASVELRVLAVLGPHTSETMLFAIFKVASVVQVGQFFQRVEALIGFVFILDAFVKIGVCVLSAARGLEKTFALGNSKQIVAPVGLFILMLSLIAFGNTLEVFDFLRAYRVIAPPFQVGIPLLIWGIAEIRLRKRQPAALGQ